MPCLWLWLWLWPVRLGSDVQVKTWGVRFFDTLPPPKAYAPLSGDPVSHHDWYL